MAPFPAIPLNMENDMIRFQVNDMTCGHCAATITKAVKALDGAAQVEIDLGKHTVAVETARAADAVRGAIEQAGYTPVPAG